MSETTKKIEIPTSLSVRELAQSLEASPIDVISEEEVKIHFTGSVLDLLIKRDDVPLASSKCDISATGATTELAAALEIQPNDPLLVFSSLLFSTRGRILDSSFSYFIPGYFHFHIVRRVGYQI